MPDPVTITYSMANGREATVRLHQVGHAGQWVLDLDMRGPDGSTVSHQHTIDGEPEVTIG